MPFPSTHNEIAVVTCSKQPWNLLPQVWGHLSSLGLQASGAVPTYWSVPGAKSACCRAQLLGDLGASKGRPQKWEPSQLLHQICLGLILLTGAIHSKTPLRSRTFHENNLSAIFHPSSTPVVCIGYKAGLLWGSGAAVCMSRHCPGGRCGFMLSF